MAKDAHTTPTPHTSSPPASIAPSTDAAHQEEKESRGGDNDGPTGGCQNPKKTVSSSSVDRRPSTLPATVPGRRHLVARERAHDLGGNVQEEDGGDEREREDNDNEGVTVGRVSWCATKTSHLGK